VLACYAYWLHADGTGGDFADEQEMSALVTEMAILLLKQYQLLEAAQLLIEHGWLSFIFGNGSRLACIADEIMKNSAWRDGEKNEIGGLILWCAASAAESERTKKVLELMDGSMHSSLTPTLERGGRP
jgi:hypothetical protein